MSTGRNILAAEKALDNCREALEEVVHTPPERRASPSITNICAWALQAIEDYKRAAAEPEAKPEPARCTCGVITYVPAHTRVDPGAMGHHPTCPRKAVDG